MVEQVRETQEERRTVRRRTGNEHHNGAKNQCPLGHAYTLENTYFDPRGCRRCKECKREELRRYKERRGLR